MTRIRCTARPSPGVEPQRRGGSCPHAVEPPHPVCVLAVTSDLAGAR